MIPHRATSSRARIRRGALLGAEFGALLLGVGVIRLTVWLADGHAIDETSLREGVKLAAFGAIYCAAFAAAGAVLAWLWPARRTLLSAYILGYVGAGIVSAVLAVLVLWLENDFEPRAYLFVTAMMTLTFGTAAGYALYKWD